MKITELVKQLNSLKRKYGDKAVFFQIDQDIQHEYEFECREMEKVRIGSVLDEGRGGKYFLSIIIS